VLLVLALVMGCLPESSVPSDAAPSGTSADAPEAVLVGAGDIAMCRTTGDEATARLLDEIAGTVMALGDNVYPAGTVKRYEDCYEVSWGRHRDRTRPAPGNHEYLAEDARGYYAYFGELAGPDQRGYYAYDLGSWRVYSLNSQLVDDEQLAWLHEDLASHAGECALAYWHYPLFSSGYHGNQPTVRPFWEALQEAGAELVIAGHDHDYERFAPQLADGRPHPSGIRSFVVGTGGAPLSGIIEVQPNSEVRQNTSRGVLELRLRDGEYGWRFVSVDGDFQDAGSGVCHGVP
jgi:3',5'-cyclic AMP phosphodiesterase CpdA